MNNPCKITKRRITFVLVCALLASSLVCVVSAQNTVVRATSSSSQPHVGDTITVKLTISNVQDLGGVDISLNWNSSVLTLSNVDLNLGVENHPDGVLHGTKLNYDVNSIVAGDIFVNEQKSLGFYELIGQTVGSTTSSFSGSGTVATLTFNVTNSGSTGLSLQSDLSNYPPAGQNANLIDHTDTADSVNVTPIPEYQSLIVIVSLMALATAALVVSKKSRSTKKP